MKPENGQTKVLEFDYLREFIINTFSISLRTLFECRRVFFKEVLYASILTWLPLVTVLISPHLNLHDFSEKTKPFYCPSGANFSTKSKDLRLTARSVCSVNSSCWTTSNGCSAKIFSTLMNKQFEVVIINLYSSEQKYNLSRFILPCAVCEYCKCVQPYKHVCTYLLIPIFFILFRIYYRNHYRKVQTE